MRSHMSPEPLDLGSLRPGPAGSGSRRGWIPISPPFGCEGAQWGGRPGGAQTHTCSPNKDSRGMFPYVGLITLSLGVPVVQPFHTTDP